MGKSTLAQKLLNDKKIAYVSTDGLTVMLKPAGIPSFYDRNKSERFFPYLEQFIERMLPVGPDYTIEGDSFTPQHAYILGEKCDVKAVFLGMSKVSVDNMLDYTKHDKWVERVTRNQLEDLAERIIQASVEIEKECSKYDIKYFDLSLGYNDKFADAYKSLIE